MTLAEQFWRRVEMIPFHECWEWAGKISHKSGYGQITNNTYGQMRSHRLAWIVQCGPIPPGLHVCHKCDNPGCVRADHLFLGTKSDNMRDMVRKGRNSNFGKRGESNAHSKLTADKAGWIRRVVADGLEHAEAAWLLGVSRTTVFNVVHGISWAAEVDSQCA